MAKSGLETFVHRPKRMDLFLESVEQGILIYSGRNLIIFAGRLDWALERKVRRIGHAAQRAAEGKDVDLPDAAALVKSIIGTTGKPLTFAYVRGLNYNGFDVPPKEETLARLANFYLKTYGSVGLVDE